MDGSIAQLLMTNLALVFAAMLTLWALSVALGDASIVDIWWGPGFAAVAVASYVMAADGNTLITTLTVVWGLRLGIYLLVRNAGKGEDPRYRAMRRHHEQRGRSFALVSLLTVFGLQGVLQWFISLPVQLAQHAGTPPLSSWPVAAGTLLWAVGLFFETVGDLQLSRFKKDSASRGQVMDRGLWRYTRHPNYFGDFCVWWGLYLVALGSQATWMSIGSPLLMSFLLMRVSGVPMLERTIGKRRPGYAEYIRRTSAFFPMPPRG
jgi:steroid 5-alpha reductase family enzyme